MMGERRIAQDNLFYEFRLEEHVPADHLLRSIEIASSIWVRFELTCLTTRPSRKTGTAGSPRATSSDAKEAVARCIAEGLVGGEGFAVDA